MRSFLDLVNYRSYTGHMETISISNLKAHLSTELKKVQKGTRIMVLDHKHPVAELIPAEVLHIFSYDTGMNRCAGALGFQVPFV